MNTFTKITITTVLAVSLSVCALVFINAGEIARFISAS